MESSPTADSRRHKDVAGRCNSLVFVLIQAERSMLSGPWMTRVTRPIGQVPRGVFLSTSRIMSPTSKFYCPCSHFRRSVNEGTYSLIQRRQNWLTSVWMKSHRFEGLKTASSAASSGIFGLARNSRRWCGGQRLRVRWVDADVRQRPAVQQVFDVDEGDRQHFVSERFAVQDELEGSFG